MPFFTEEVEEVGGIFWPNWRNALEKSSMQTSVWSFLCMFPVTSCTNSRICVSQERDSLKPCWSCRQCVLSLWMLYRRGWWVWSLPAHISGLFEDGGHIYQLRVLWYLPILQRLLEDNCQLLNQFSSQIFEDTRTNVVWSCDLPWV